jgi:hypothetical protein
VSRIRILVVGLAFGLLGFAQNAFATEISLPAGSVAKLTNVKTGACNKLAYGYQLDGGAQVELGSFAGGCGEMGQANATIGPFGATHVLRFYLEDRTCNFTFFSDGSAGSLNHGNVTGSNPYKLALRDGGGFCEFPPGKELPPSEGGNVTATVTIGVAGAPEPPDFGRCVKLATKTGRYSVASCTKNVAGSKTESLYEWQSGVGPNHKYTATGGVSTLFETREGDSAACASETASGEYSTSSDNKHMTMSLVSAGCHVVNSPNGAINGASCQTAGRAEGEVADNPLVGEIGWLNHAKKQTALLLEPAPGNAPDLTPVIECAGFQFQVLASGRGLLVPIKNGSMRLEETLKFKQLRGIQKPDVWHVGEPDEETTFLDLTGAATGQSGIGFELKIKNEEKLEVSAIA